MKRAVIFGSFAVSAFGQGGDIRWTDRYDYPAVAQCQWGFEITDSSAIGGLQNKGSRDTRKPNFTARLQCLAAGIIQLLGLFSLLGLACGANAQTDATAATKAAVPAPAKHEALEPKKSAHANHAGLAADPTLYVVGYAHLDTEWRWE